MDEWLDEGTLVGAGFVIGNPEMFTADDWAELFDVQAVDVIGDVVLDASSGASLLIRSGLPDIDIERIVDDHVRRLVALGPQMQSLMRESLTTAMREGVTVGDLASHLEKSGPLSAVSAQATARTELAAAANAGLQSAWSRGKVPLKRWVSARDSRVREAHAIASGQTVPVDLDFDIGGYRAAYPGDPQLPIALRVNCRCHMERIDADGAVQSDSLETATKQQLYDIARELRIPGRSRMRRDELQASLGDWLSGNGDQRIDLMTRNQLLGRAKLLGVTGRHRMNKSQLTQAVLRTGKPGTARWRADMGFVSEAEHAVDVKRAAKDIGGRQIG